MERLASTAGIELRRHGADLLGLCPFHDDHEPLPRDLAKEEPVALPRGLLGRRQRRRLGDALGRGFLPTCRRLLRDGRGSAGPISGPAPQRSTVRKLPSPVDRSSRRRRTARSGGRLLPPDAPRIARGARLPPLPPDRPSGRDPRPSSSVMPTAPSATACRRRTGRKGAELRGRLQAIGVFRQSGHEHFSGSLVVPVTDSAGWVVEMYGRGCSPRQVGNYPNAGVGNYSNAVASS